MEAFLSFYNIIDFGLVGLRLTCSLYLFFYVIKGKIGESPFTYFFLFEILLNNNKNEKN